MFISLANFVCTHTTEVRAKKPVLRQHVDAKMSSLSCLLELTFSRQKMPIEFTNILVDIVCYILSEHKELRNLNCMCNSIFVYIFLL